nr:hypothetical protein [Streptomyces alanosinicus]
MSDAIASWATTRSDQYKGYEPLIDKVKQYSFAKSLQGCKVLAGTPGDVTQQLADIRDWHGDDLCVPAPRNRPEPTACWRSPPTTANPRKKAFSSTS